MAGIRGGDPYEERLVRPRGRAIRLRRTERGWSPRELVAAIAARSLRATGRPEAISPNLLWAMEERDEPVPYRVLCLVAAGLDCDPVDLQAFDGEEGP